MEYDSTYSGYLLSSFNKMRLTGVMCDFTVNVGDATFPVHRVVLAAGSEYFTAMFSSNMKEVQQASVDMKFRNSLGVRKCIEYLYTGGVELDSKSVEHTLEESKLMQLNGLTSICFKFLMNNLSAENCLSAIKLSSVYEHDEIGKLAEEYILKNFEAVTLTEMFPLIDEHALQHYIEASNAKHDVAWQAVMRWFSVAREESGIVLFDVMKGLSLPKFPFSTENFFTVKNLSKLYDIPISEEIKGIVTEYLEENFEDLVDQNGFNNLEGTEIVSLLQSVNTICSSEKTKWDATLKWTKYDEHHRKTFFVKLFKSINWRAIPRDFILQNVLQETIVDESHVCKNILLRISFRRDLCIACLNIHNGNMKAMDLSTNQFKDLPTVHFRSRLFLRKQRQVINIKNEMLCLDFEKVLKLDQNDKKWIEKQSRKNQPTEFCEVVEFQKQVHVVDRGAMACYNVDNDIWEENLPGCGLDGSFCAASCDKFIYAMGGRKDNRRIADVKRYDSTTRSWSELEPMNTPRSRASGVVFNKKVFVVGGRKKNKSLDTVEFYDPLVNKWTYLMSLCVSRWNPSTCVANNHLYVVGGDGDKKSDSHSRNSIEIYDEVANNWKIVKKYDWVSGFTPCCAINVHR